jgi:predicted ATPase
LTRRRIEEEIALSDKHEIPLWQALGTILRGWVLAEQGQGAKGIEQIRHGMVAWLAIGVELARPHYFALLTEAYGRVGQTEEGFRILDEAVALVNKTGERWYEAEIYRLKGEVTLQQQSKVQSPKSKVHNRQTEAEACFLKAIDVARKQQAKLLELRAVMSLARLWQQQGRKDEAQQMLAELYGWFTEGFDTKDLQEAKTLLEELGG